MPVATWYHKAMQDLIKILDPNLVLVDKKIDLERNELTIWARMGTESEQCPYCGTWSSSVQGHYTRVLKDFTVMGMPTTILVETRKFYCGCEDCSHKTFAEPLPFAKRYSRKTDRVWDYMDELHTCMSAVEAAEILSDNLFPIHYSTLIRHLMKKEEAVAPKKVLVVAICIDDLALRKRFSYATAIIDAITHELLDLIPSRTAEDVAKALEQYPGLQIVSRDGAACFRNGVLALEDGETVVQITDRFHLIMNCTKAADMYLKARLPKALPLSGPVEKADSGSMSTAVLERKLRILTAQQLFETGLPVREIAAQMGLCEDTVRRYLKMDPDALPAGNRRKYEKLLPYFRKIGELMAQQVSVKAIYEAITERGYTGSIHVLYEYVRARKAGNLTVPTEDSLSRALLLKRLYKPLDEIPLLAQEDYDRALEHYPFVAEVFEWTDQLREILKSKDVEALEAWLTKGEDFKSGAIKSYINGLRRDLDAVREAILLPFSNGPMEGTVNKLKVCRRIMYGRCGFPFFRVKALAKERLRRARQARLAEAKQKAHAV